MRPGPGHHPTLSTSSFKNFSGLWYAATDGPMAAPQGPPWAAKYYVGCQGRCYESHTILCCAPAFPWQPSPWQWYAPYAVDQARAIREAAALLGFTRCGFAAVGPVPRERFLRNWLAEGRAGQMAYLSRRFRGRLDPRRLFSWARSVVTVAYPYPPPPPPPADWRAELRGRIAAYALGGDYHNIVGERLKRLAAQIVGLEPGGEAQAYVDTGPVLEREWGYRSGIGWFGKNTMLLERRGGSWFFLGEVFTNLELPTAPLPQEHCGTCRRCLDACPTDALGDDFRIDPRCCISYLTIEHRGSIPRGLRRQMGNWLFGCDVCQDVCPWNAEPGDPASFEWLYPRLPELLQLDAAGFRHHYGGTALARTKRRGLVRNAAIALGNSGNPDAVFPLTQALSDPEPIVRGHAAWALGRIGETAASDALERGLRRETDPWASDEITAALAECRDGAGRQCEAAPRPLP